MSSKGTGPGGSESAGVGVGRGCGGGGACWVVASEVTSGVVIGYCNWRGCERTLQN